MWRKKLIKKPSFTLNLIITENCNLKCKYCYVNQSSKEISYEVIDAAIDFLDNIKNDYEIINVELFGGEPLVAFDKVKYYINKIKEKNFNNIYTGLFTNGILLNNKEISNFLILNKQYIKVINLSLDGCKISHDSTRIKNNLEGSYDKVLQGLNTFCDLEKTSINRFYPSYTVSPDNCEYLLESAKELSDLGFTKLALKPVRDNIWDQNSLEKYKSSMYKLKKWYINNLDKIELPIFTLPFLIQEQKRPYYCSCGKDFYSISPEGDIYPCPRFYFNKSPYKLGNILSKEIFQNNFYINLFEKYTKINYVNCSKCEEFKNKNCLGMCIAACYEDSGTLFTTIPEVCEIHKFNYKIALEFEEECKNNELYWKLRNKKY